MIDSIFVALSGMLGHQQGLKTISNNVANLNTPGFRGSVVSFADVFNGAPDGQLSGQRQHGVGGGLDATRTRLDMRPGASQQTGNALDLFLEGSGFFVLQDDAGNLRYSRDGAFKFDTSGTLVASGQELKVMSRNASGVLAPVTLDGLRLSAAKATGELSFAGNLSNAEDDQGHTIDSVVVTDKNGSPHTLRLEFRKDSAATPDGSFDVMWKLSVFEGSDQVGTSALPFLASRVAAGKSPLTMALALRGAEPATIAFDFDNATGASLGTTSDLSVQKQDGFPQGAITAETFDETGMLKITYSNGQTADGAKLVFADIPDDGGLEAVGDALFVYRGPQAVTLRASGDDLKVRSRSIELSNVDLTHAFSELILVQRGYQASSQVLSTANDMLQELLQMRGGK